MRRFIFVIDGEGVENWMPMDLEFGERFHDGVYYGPEFYKERASLNWDRGCYSMETNISQKDEKKLVRLLGRDRNWLKAKRFIEKLTKRNFETETGFENPYDPNWNYNFDMNWEQKRRLWLERAGISDFDPRALVLLRTEGSHRHRLDTKAEKIIIDGAKRSICLYDSFPLLSEHMKKSMIPMMEAEFSDLLIAQ